MKTSSFGRRSESDRAARRAGRGSRRRPLVLEALEARVVMSLTPQMVLDNNPAAPSSYPMGVVAIGSTAYFMADDGVHGQELWKSDGTAAGTMMIKDIRAGSGGSAPNNLTDVNGTLYFSAFDEACGDELWKSDGTAAGTTLVKDINPGTHLQRGGYPDYGYSVVPNDGAPRDFENVNGVLYFRAEEPEHGSELWRSDGTANGTRMVSDIEPGGASSGPGDLTNVGGTLFFRASYGTLGRELWKSDGTAAGTTLVKDIYPGTTRVGDPYSGYADVPNDGDPRGLSNVNGRLFFSVDDGVHGRELWTLAEVTTPAVSGFPATITAGVAGGFTLTARNSDGTADAGFRGIVRFSSSDPRAVLPAEYTFTAADAGRRTYIATLKTAGSQSLTATVLGSGGGTATQSGITVNPAAASRLSVAGFPSPTTAGVAGSFTVTALDPFGNRATGYRGTARLGSSDATAALPGSYAFTAADAGLHAFSATLKRAGTQSLTATDTVSAAIIGTQTGILVNPAAASRLVLGAPASVKANVQFNLTVTVVDAYGNVVTGFRGTLAFASSDPAANLPGSYTFTATDRGVHTFTKLVLKRTGRQTITATDTRNRSLAGIATLDVL